MKVRDEGQICGKCKWNAALRRFRFSCFLPKLVEYKILCPEECCRESRYASAKALAAERRALCVYVHIRLVGDAGNKAGGEPD